MDDRIELILHGGLASLARGRRKKRLPAMPHHPGQSVKDILQSLGIPWTEVGPTMSGDRSVSAGHQPEPGECLRVFPAEAIPDLSHAPKEGPPRFLCDDHLGRLSRRLRLLGFDTALNTPPADPVTVANVQGRTLLTRSRHLLMENRLHRGYLVKNQGDPNQLLEVTDRFNLAAHLAVFSRCLRCNGILTPMDPGDIDRTIGRSPAIPLRVRQVPHVYSACASCGRIYWDGTHVKRLRRFIQDIFPDVPRSPYPFFPCRIDDANPRDGF